MDICIVGTGYVGLVTGACLADLGNDVICIDNDSAKIRKLKAGRIPIYEPGLEELVRRNLKTGRLSFGTAIRDGVKRSKIIFIAVGTPSKENGEADLTFVENVSLEIAVSMSSYRLIVEKSTVPVNTGEWVEHTIKAFNKRNIDFDVASNPEFLREGSAIEDFMHPERIVLGVKTRRASDTLVDLYKTLKAPIVITDIKSAEIIKHSSNSFLAAKISFINGVANICDRVGADVADVVKGMGLDSRIGKNFLQPGIGFGGSCFPKDVSAFIRISENVGYDFGLLKEVQRINDDQKRCLLKKIADSVWNLPKKTVGILGLSFKPDTDDMREAPSIGIISMLLKEGVKVKVYDPKSMAKARTLLRKGVKFCKDAYAAAKDCNCLVVITEWNEFRDLDLKRIKKLMKQPVVVDGRNIYDPAQMRKLGFKYTGMGRR